MLITDGHDAAGESRAPGSHATTGGNSLLGNRIHRVPIHRRDACGAEELTRFQGISNDAAVQTAVLPSGWWFSLSSAEGTT